MLNTIISSWPSFAQEDADAVSNVLLSNKVNYWTGEQGKLFEKEFAHWVGCEYAVAMANGTLALELALSVLNLNPDDEVITSPRSFIATASSIVRAGAIPVFADVDLNSQNITAEFIKEVITEKTKAIVVVHLAGMPAEMDDIMELANKHDLIVIEDCAQAHGALYKGRSVGTIGHLGCWSFCQDKIMTTGGEGGMVTTNNQELWEKLWAVKEHGKNYQAMYRGGLDFGFRWLHDSIGTNARMTEMQAVIGRVQLKKMTSWTQAREKNAQYYNLIAQQFSGLRIIDVPEYIRHGRYKHYVFILPNKLKQNWTRDKIIREINFQGVPCLQGSCAEIYLEKAFVKLCGIRKIRLHNAKVLGETSLMFLIHPTLVDKDRGEITRALEKVFKQAFVD